MPQPDLLLPVRKRSSKALGFLIGILFILIGALWFSRSVWLAGMGRFLVVNEPLEKSDVLVVVTGMHMPQRLRHTARLYHEGWAPQVLISGDFDLFRETRRDLILDYALQLGIPQEAILREKDSNSTRENAELSLRLLKELRMDSAIVVTSPPHSRRTRGVFQNVFPDEIRFRISCEEKDFDTSRWWKIEASKREGLYEYFNLLLYLIEGPALRRPDAT